MCKTFALIPSKNLSPVFTFQFLNDKIHSYTKKAIWHLASWQNWFCGQFYHSKIVSVFSGDRFF